jgi:hypothetical protein
MEVKAITKEELEALEQAVEILSKVDKSDGDLFDAIGVLASDVAEVYKQYFDKENPTDYEAQRKDAVNTALNIALQLNNF